MIPFLISQFAKEALSNLVKECFGSDFPDILTKPQVDYIYRYLADLGAESVVLESQYVDRDYLDDFSKFYARQFSNRGHMCARLHFFARAVNHAVIESVVSGSADEKEQKSIEESYLGFIVVRPLPRTFIGRMCLKGYPQSEGQSGSRHLLTREYRVSLFGMSLKVDSIAFQEQDKVVAACATTAIWSLLHASGFFPVTEIPSLSQITTDAINFIPQSNNGFPNKELSNKQILRALDVRGLRHHAHKAPGGDASWLIETIKSYVDSGYPLILVCQVGKVFSEDGEDPGGERLAKDVGGHAVTVVGYKAGRIGEGAALYLHDDRTGPFARAVVAPQGAYKLEEFSAHNGGSDKGVVLELQHKGPGGWARAHEVLVPTTLIAATPRNIRVSADAVRQLGVALTKMVGVVSGAPLEAGEFTAEVTLSSINDIKAEFRKDMRMRRVVGMDQSSRSLSDSKNRLAFLTQNFARYQWCLDLKSAGRRLFRVMVDATDIPQGDAVSAIIYDQDGFEFVEVLRQAATVQHKYAQELGDSALFDSFVRHFIPRVSGIAEYLDSKFGPLRAPTYLKAPEICDGRLTANTSRRVFYEPSDQSLDEIFVGRGSNLLIWVVNEEGALVVGIEEAQSNIGHPALTGSKPARIAGEIKRGDGGCWVVNGKSGRYSGDYSDKDTLVGNAVSRFTRYFGHVGDSFRQE
ncbi:TPA: hypothetical protein QEL16_004303 [Stenotrophomonas maltophilia]|uniref:hypothetical protein n=1 Tax=Stenotrophomonas sp. PS02298 TaxID=2991424 RepID=UPI002499B91A|nr:hypothetical protein [Stenotrophomonas sp. PS02298]HDS1590458.1 hypothetical protein [Stenotrophomonas maltophilia]HDS1643563.1 hypothetical protein [Stenotrophomonas maltophilia]